MLSVRSFFIILFLASIVNASSEAVSSDVVALGGSDYQSAEEEHVTSEKSEMGASKAKSKRGAVIVDEQDASYANSHPKRPQKARPARVVEDAASLLHEDIPKLLAQDGRMSVPVKGQRSLSDNDKSDTVESEGNESDVENGPKAKKSKGKRSSKNRSKRKPSSKSKSSKPMNENLSKNKSPSKGQASPSSSPQVKVEPKKEAEIAPVRVKPSSQRGYPLLTPVEEPKSPSGDENPESVKLSDLESPVTSLQKRIGNKKNIRSESDDDTSDSESYDSNNQSDTEPSSGKDKRVKRGGSPHRRNHKNDVALTPSAVKVEIVRSTKLVLHVEFDWAKIEKVMKKHSSVSVPSKKSKRSSHRNSSD